MGRVLSSLISLLVLAGPAFGQPAAGPPSFEVVGIKPADPANPIPGKGRVAGGRVDLPGMSVKMLVQFAYGVQEDMIVGAPKWADTERFDIVAKAVAETPMATMRLMFQTMLAERFKLAIHREEKVMPAYVLTVGKRALKLHEGDGGRQTCSWSNLEGGLRKRECHNLTMSEFARQLPGWGGIGIDLPVIDETGLKGAYDFQLEVGFAGLGDKGLALGKDGGGAKATPEFGPTIFMALDKVGLKLESRKIALPAIVVDKVDHPTDN